jgi:hypothetical protein
MPIPVNTAPADLQPALIVACNELSDRVDVPREGTRAPESWVRYFAARPGSIDLAKLGAIWAAVVYTDATKQTVAAANAVPVIDCDVATTAALAANTLTAGELVASANGALANIDGQAPALKKIVLVKNEADATKLGFYVITDLGSAGTPWKMKRVPGATLQNKAATLVKTGTANANKVFRITTANPIVAGTTAIAFAELASASAVEALFEVATALQPTVGLVLSPKL